MFEKYHSQNRHIFLYIYIIHKQIIKTQVKIQQFFCIYVMLVCKTQAAIM